MKIKILFVDDEPNIISGIKRMMFSMKSEWEMFFALSGQEALNRLASDKIDIIISDMRMPGMDGAALLEKVKELYPSTIRIILSGYSDKDLLMRAANSAHQILAKPIDAQILKKIIEQLYFLQTILTNQAILKIANGVKALPSLPELYLKIEEELKKPDPSLKMVDRIISKDIIMTAKILQVVNSAFFGLPNKILNPLEAINFLGIEVVKALVLVVHFFNCEQNDPVIKNNFNMLWENSLKTASVCKKMSKSEKIDPKMLDAIVTAGLLHDIGKLVMWQLDDYFIKIKEFSEHYKKTITEAESILYKTTHAEVGAYLVGVWGLPEILVKLIYYHHTPTECPEKELFALHIVHTAIHIVTNEPIDENYQNDPIMTSTINRWIKVFSKDVNYE